MLPLRTDINNFIFIFICFTLKFHDKKFFRKVVFCEIHSVVACQHVVAVANFDECRCVSRVKQE